MTFHCIISNTRNNNINNIEVLTFKLVELAPYNE